MNTKIILSAIVHKRYDKIQHFFKYKVSSLFIDLDELEVIKSKSRSFQLIPLIYFPSMKKIMDIGMEDQ